jgi:dolichyl-diphosphooligosaccharide--protein glycosyltransferase
MAPKKAAAAAVASPATQPPVILKSSSADVPPIAVISTSAPKQKLAWPLPRISRSSIDNTQSFLRFVILAFICGAAVASRLFAVIRFESVIHEFDPWFN